MNPEVSITPSIPQSLDQLLNSAVVLNWEALTQSATSGRVRVEYYIGGDGALEYLKLWNHAREYWSLICEYSVHSGWSDGPRFCNGYHSRSLSRLLQSIMILERQSTQNHIPNTNGRLEVGPPTAQDIETATLQVSETFQLPTLNNKSKRGIGVRATLAESQ